MFCKSFHLFTQVSHLMIAYRIQPPGVFHEVYTPVKSIASGGHFLTYGTLHLTEIARAYDNSPYGEWTRKIFTTNNEHEAVPRQLSRMLLALPLLVDTQGKLYWYLCIVII